jgi:hypothetical protein
MAPLSAEELQADIRDSDLLTEYGKAIDRDSAREILAKRMARTVVQPGSGPQPGPESGPQRGKSIADIAGDVVSSSVGRTVVREVVRGLFGLLGAKPPRAGTTRRSRW